MNASVNSQLEKEITENGKAKKKGPSKMATEEDEEIPLNGDIEEEINIAESDDLNAANVTVAVETGVDVPDGVSKGRQSNTYAAKKTVAQGMMDIALITANANQLRYLLEYGKNSPTYYLNIILISISLLLQIAVGISLIFKGRLDMQGKSKHRHAKQINNYVVVGVFLITLINVFIASFTMTVPTSSAT